ncbi:hypothetical protein SAMN05444166_4159 [Singulisphaera sp. GP187]|nr:hypothetical protein SAMN05444166_4159 [Singulisphaera sp. GP187]
MKRLTNRLRSMRHDVRWAICDLRNSHWHYGFQWPPKFAIGRMYYDGWWYYLHLGPFWVNAAPYPDK